MKNLVCPWCRTKHSAADDYDWYPEDYETNDLHCKNCGKEYQAEARISVRYLTSAKDGDDND